MTEVRFVVRFKGKRARGGEGIKEHLLQTFNDDGSIESIEIESPRWAGVMTINEAMRGVYQQRRREEVPGSHGERHPGTRLVQPV